MAKNRKSIRIPRGPTPGKHATAATRETTDTRLDAVYRQIREILEQARAKVVRARLIRRWYAPTGSSAERSSRRSRMACARASYGDELIDHLAVRLRADFGRGYTPTNLRYMRLFYLAYPNLLAREIHHASHDEFEREAGDSVSPVPADDGTPTGSLNPSAQGCPDPAPGCAGLPVQVLDHGHPARRRSRSADQRGRSSDGDDLRRAHDVACRAGRQHPRNLDTYAAAGISFIMPPSGSCRRRSRVDTSFGESRSFFAGRAA